MSEKTGKVCKHSYMDFHNILKEWTIPEKWSECTNEDFAKYYQYVYHIHGVTCIDPGNVPLANLYATYRNRMTQHTTKTFSDN